jgi:hypothetical protein
MMGQLVCFHGSSTSAFTTDGEATACLIPPEKKLPTQTPSWHVGDEKIKTMVGKGSCNFGWFIREVYKFSWHRRNLLFIHWCRVGALSGMAKNLLTLSKKDTEVA